MRLPHPLPEPERYGHAVSPTVVAFSTRAVAKGSPSNDRFPPAVVALRQPRRLRRHRLQIAPHEVELPRFQIRFQIRFERRQRVAQGIVPKSAQNEVRGFSRLGGAGQFLHSHPFALQR